MAMSPRFERTFLGPIVVAVAAVLAVGSALHHAVCWHDGSRLAMVEALVDHHTWAIDESIFVAVPDYPAGEGPYPDDQPLLRAGTKDKLYIDGHFYSDKPVAALLLAGAYRLWQWCGGPAAHAQPVWFCWAMALLGAGLPYVIAVGCVDRLGVVLRLPLHLRLALTAGFGLATMAPVYSRMVNVHIELLAVVAGVVLGVARLGESIDGGTPWLRLGVLGTLVGLGYTLDLGAGPPLVFGLLVLLAYRYRRPGPVLVAAAAALPWIALHQAINYAIGGTLRPINSVPEYSTWPGCPFTPESLTGTWKHTPTSFLLYAASMFAGKRGLWTHNLPLLLTVPALLVLLRQRRPQRAELLFLGGWCTVTWLMYAALSNNSSGCCCSIRWFVPFLAPAFYALALLLRDRLDFRRDYFVLSPWGVVLTAVLWWYGPADEPPLALLWPLVGAALASWAARRLLFRPGAPAPTWRPAGPHFAALAAGAAQPDRSV